MSNNIKPFIPSNRPPTPIPSAMCNELTGKRDYVYINSSNGYLDREVTTLKSKVNTLEAEIKLLKILLQKQNKTE